MTNLSRAQVDKALARHELNRRRAEPHARLVMEHLRAWSKGKAHDLESLLRQTPILDDRVPASDTFPTNLLGPNRARTAINLSAAWPERSADMLSYLVGFYPHLPANPQ